MRNDQSVDPEGDNGWTVKKIKDNNNNHLKSITITKKMDNWLPGEKRIQALNKNFTRISTCLISI